MFNRRRQKVYMQVKDIPISLYECTSELTCISRKPNALPIAVAVKSLPPLPKVVTARDFHPCHLCIIWQ